MLISIRIISRPREALAVHLRPGSWLAILLLSVTAISGCVDETPAPATAVPLQPTVARPALATPAPVTPSPAPLVSAVPSIPPGGRTFTVREGDTLSTIAGQIYGDAGQWRVIFEANRDQLSSEDQLRVGQILRVPPLPAATATTTPTRTP